MSVQVKVDNTNLWKKEFHEALERSMQKIGMEAQSVAVKKAPVDTGLLRNSITYALAGKPPAVTSYKADRGGESGRYSGSEPEDGPREKSVYIGTNVEYARHQELGTSKTKAHPFLRPAANQASKFRKIIQSELQNG